MVICLERRADLHMAQLMSYHSLPLASVKSRLHDFTFLVPAHPGSPGKGPLNWCVCDDDTDARQRQGGEERKEGCRVENVTFGQLPYLTDKSLELLARVLESTHKLQHTHTHTHTHTHARLTALFPGLPG